MDHDDWAKTDCQCGHRRYAHGGGVGACTRTKKIHTQPEGVEWVGDGFGSWPTVPVSEWPLVEGPCPCRAFFDAEETLAESRGEW